MAAVPRDVLEDGGDAERQFDEPKFEQWSDTMTTVRVDGPVLLKIIKHDEAEHDSLATGVLLGLDVYDEMQVTNCFALPADSRDLRGFQLSMLSRLQEVNADNNMVGWYMCGSSGSLVSQDVISRQFVMQDELLSKAVLLVYDPSMTAQGTVGLRAFRLTEKFMDLYREGDFRLPSVARASLDSRSIFEELPITLSNPLVLQALVYQLKVTHPPHESEFDALDLSVAPYLQRQVEGLVGHVEEMTQKQHDLVDVERSIARQKSSQTQAKQHKMLEGKGSKGGSGGEEPQADMLDALLGAGEINEYCQAIAQFAEHGQSTLELGAALAGADISES